MPEQEPWVSVDGMEVDILHPFEPLRPIATDSDPARPGRLRQWYRRADG